MSEQSLTEVMKSTDPMTLAIPLIALLAVGALATLYMDRKAGIPWQATVLRAVGGLCMPIAFVLSIFFILQTIALVFLAFMAAGTTDPTPLTESIPLYIGNGIAAALFAAMGQGFQAAACEAVQNAEPSPNVNGGGST